MSGVGNMGFEIRKHAIPILMLAPVLLTGCATATLSPQPAFQDVADNVAERTGKKIAWASGDKDDLAMQAHVRGLLSRPLSPSRAVQVALLNNRSLRATYAQLGMAQAELVQAGMLSNPVFDGSVIWPYEPKAAAADVTVGVVFNFIELFWRRYKEAVARSALEETKLQVAGMVIDHAAKTNIAFIDYVAANQEVRFDREVLTSARAAFETAKALRKAGNSTSLDYEQQQSVLTQAKLELANAEARAAVARERLNVLMGLAGSDTKWRAPTRLPAPREHVRDHGNIERVAVERSLELAALRQKIITLGYQHQLTNRKSLIPDIGLGVEYEKKEADGGVERSVGPTFDVTLPLFDQGQAKKARSIMALRQAQDAYWETAIRVRSAARVARVERATALRTLTYYRRAVIPQQERLLRATQQQYNAMQADVFRLIRARREQIAAQRAYISVVAAYWRAQTNYQQLLSGRLPSGGSGGTVVVASAAPAGAGDAGGH